MTFNLILAEGEKRTSQAHTILGIPPLAISILHLVKSPLTSFTPLYFKQLFKMTQFNKAVPPETHKLQINKAKNVTDKQSKHRIRKQ